jgi:hypothetical protein
MAHLRVKNGHLVRTARGHLATTCGGGGFPIGNPCSQCITGTTPKGLLVRFTGILQSATPHPCDCPTAFNNVWIGVGQTVPACYWNTEYGTGSCGPGSNGNMGFAVTASVTVSGSDVLLRVTAQLWYRGDSRENVARFTKLIADVSQINCGEWGELPLASVTNADTQQTCHWDVSPTCEVAPNPNA